MARTNRAPAPPRRFLEATDSHEGSRAAMAALVTSMHRKGKIGIGAAAQHERGAAAACAGRRGPRAALGC